MKHVGGAFIALLIGLACWYSVEVRPEARTLAALAGVLVAFLAEVIIILIIRSRELLHSGGVHAKAIMDEQKRIAIATESALGRIENQQETLLELVRERIRKGEELEQVLHYHGRELSPAQMHETWLELLNRLETGYNATNYIRQIYDSSWANAAFHMQNAKKKANPSKCHIKKVFLIAEDSEIEGLSDHVEEQKAIDIDLHLLPMAEVKRDASLNHPLETNAIESIDFGVFEDNSHVLIWKLEDRKVTGGHVLFGEDVVKPYQEYFNLLFQKAAEYNRDRLVLIPMTQKIIEKISAWPKYQAPYEAMDYALRNPGGWLYVQGSLPRCRSFAAYADGILIGFSLLVADGNGGAEFYVAIHPRRFASGHGRRLTEASLRKGFNELAFTGIHLKVRKDLPHRIKLYSKAGFKETGNATELTNGENVEFLTMNITAKEFRARQVSDAGSAGARP